MQRWYNLHFTDLNISENLSFILGKYSFERFSKSIQFLSLIGNCHFLHFFLWTHEVLQNSSGNCSNKCTEYAPVIKIIQDSKSPRGKLPSVYKQS